MGDGRGGAERARVEEDARSGGGAARAWGGSATCGSAEARVAMGFKGISHDEELSQAVEKRC